MNTVIEDEQANAEVDLAELVAQALMDKIDEHTQLDPFLDHVIAKVRSWRDETGEIVLDRASTLADLKTVSRGDQGRLFHRYENDNFSALRTRLLVSSFKSGPQDGGVFEIDFAANSYRQVIHCDGRGITKYNGGFIVASRDRGLFVLDDNLNVTMNHPLPPLDVHGVAFGPDGLLYVVETRHNRVGIYTLEPFERIDEIIVSPDSEDRNHVNDLCFRDGKLLLSMFSTQEFWRENLKTEVFDGAIVEYDLQEKQPLRTIASGLQMPHTLKVAEGELCYCESFGLNVVRSEMKIAQYYGYTRGIDFDGQYLFVGQSRLRHRKMHAELTLSSDAGVHILDANEHLSRFIPLPTPDIYGILILD